MTVTVLLFASYADAFGGSSIEVDLEDGCVVEDLVGRLRARPGGERLPPRPMVAVNERYAGLSDPICFGDEIAVIPPVAGG